MTMHAENLFHIFFSLIHNLDTLLNVFHIAAKHWNSERKLVWQKCFVISIGMTENIQQAGAELSQAQDS